MLALKRWLGGPWFEQRLKPSMWWVEALYTWVCLVNLGIALA